MGIVTYCVYDLDVPAMPLSKIYNYKCNVLFNNIILAVTSNITRYMTNYRVICNGYYIRKL